MCYVNYWEALVIQYPSFHQTWLIDGALLPYYCRKGSAGVHVAYVYAASTLINKAVSYTEKDPCEMELACGFCLVNGASRSLCILSVISDKPMTLRAMDVPQLLCLQRITYPCVSLRKCGVKKDTTYRTLHLWQILTGSAACVARASNTSLHKECVERPNSDVVLKLICELCVRSAVTATCLVPPMASQFPPVKNSNMISIFPWKVTTGFVYEIRAMDS